MKTISPIIFRRGKKINLCIVRKMYLPRITKWINDPEVTHYLSTYMPALEADEEKWFNSLSEKKATDHVFALVLPSGVPIGLMGLHQINMANGTATSGAMIGEKQYWGRGYGSEAKMLLLDYAFNTLGLRKVCSSVIAYNERSFHYSKKCGYEEEGRKRLQFYRNGAYHDEICLAVFREKWLPLWQRFKKTERLK